MDTSSPVSGKLAGPVTLLKRTIASYKKNSQDIIKLVSIQFVLIVISALLGGFARFLLTNHPDSASLLVVPMMFIVFPLGILSFLAQTFSLLALVKRLGDIDKGIPFPGVIASFKGVASLFWPYIWMSILMGTIILALFIVFFWIAAIPAFVFSLFFSFAMFTLVFDGERGLRALTSSWYYVQNNFWKVLGRSFFVLLISLVIGLFFGAGAFVLYLLTNHGLGTMDEARALLAGSTPISFEIFQLVINLVYVFVIVPCLFIFGYEMFKDLKTLKPQYSIEVEGKKRTWAKVFAIIGAILIPLMFISMPIIAMIFGMKEAQNRARNGSIEQSFSKTYDNGVLSFTYPGNWAASSTKEGLLLQSPLGAQVYMAKFDLSANSTPSPLNELSDKFTNSLEKEYKGDTQFEIYATADDVVVGGQKSVRILYGHSSEMAKEPRLLSEMVLVPYESSIFTIELTDTETGMQVSEDQLLSILETINFK